MVSLQLLSIYGAILLRDWQHIWSRIPTQVSIIFTMFYATRGSCRSVSVRTHGHSMHMPLIMKILAKHFSDGQVSKYPWAYSGRRATCIKFKVFTAIFSLHFTEIVFRLFASCASFAHCELKQCTGNGYGMATLTHAHTRALTHTLAHTYCAKCIVCVFLSWVEFGLVWQPRGRFTCSACSNCYGCHILCFCGSSLGLVLPVFRLQYPVRNSSCGLIVL